MKKLIPSLILISFLIPATGAAKEVQEVTEVKIKNKFLSVVQDVHVEQTVGLSAEFNKCREKNVFNPKDTPAERNSKLTSATNCFKQELGTSRDAKSLQKLSESLKLESHGLIKSNSVNEITTYLTNKMIKSLTGRDPEEKDPQKIIEQMKWENQKIVDQKVFIELYTNQLLKNALFEASRYCFENLRINNNLKTKFDEHWTTANFLYVDSVKYKKPVPDVSKLNDLGEPSFFSLPSNIDMSKKEDVAKAMLGGLAGSSKIDPVLYEKYYSYCRAAIPVMCDKFKTLSSKNFSSAPQDKELSVDTHTIKPTLKDGSNACLTLDRLQEIRTAMANTEKVSKQFDELGDGKDAFAIKMISQPKFYQKGDGDGEESIDALTSVSSADILGQTKDDKLGKLAKDCSAGKGSECNDYLVESDGLDRSIQNVETEMNLKREVEMARVRAMKNKPKELREYLTENGMFDLLAELEGGLTEDQLAVKIGAIYDARRLALVEGLKLKVGKRQVSEKDAVSDADKKDLRIKNIQSSREEKARLAQVVMFNNIITSQLTLKDADSGKDVGRNVTGWNKEIKGLTEQGGFKADDQLFQGLQTIAKKEGNTKTNTSVIGSGIIDSILGKAEEPDPKNPKKP